MIVAISNYVLSNAINGNTSQTIEFPFTISILTKLFDKYAIRIENLDSAKSIRYEIKRFNERKNK